MSELTFREAYLYWENCRETKLTVMKRMQMMIWYILRAVRMKFISSADKTVAEVHV